ncbi:hypothetical protein QWZ08_01835 [Ferruginibacter paludis]|uniref:hypothetical protein n=1 Tax=Ferruginibacter paludis TaxID=1310417 RepID=UPI0025B544B9|nr:hypothetical protein [Ferruginibacter paludis]MDN3654346.1 hypothetical protein [Ferruginibacter paludis]
MKKNIFLLTACALFALQFSACKKSDPAAIPPRTDIHLDSTNALGSHIVDKDGKTLYYFSNDVNGQSNCTGGCLTNWPVFAADSTTTTFGTGLQATDFKTILTSTGAKQTTYKGWPLYYYSPGGVLEAAGQTTGEGVGNIWFVAKPNYSITIANFQLTGADGKNYLSTYAPGDGRTSYFSDDKGNTLYAFGRDSFLVNKFTKADFTNNSFWPIYETDNITVPSILDKTLFAVITFNGKKQLTYNGWPLYYFGGDAQTRGFNKGITIPPTLPVGSLWPIVNKTSAAAPKP